MGTSDQFFSRDPVLCGWNLWFKGAGPPTIALGLISRESAQSLDTSKGYSCEVRFSCAVSFSTWHILILIYCCSACSLSTCNYDPLLHIMCLKAPNFVGIVFLRWSWKAKDEDQLRSWTWITWYDRTGMQIHVNLWLSTIFLPVIESDQTFIFLLYGTWKIQPTMTNYQIPANGLFLCHKQLPTRNLNFIAGDCFTSGNCV